MTTIGLLSQVGEARIFERPKSGGPLRQDQLVVLDASL